MPRTALTDASPHGRRRRVFVRGVVTQRMPLPDQRDSQNYGFFLQSTTATPTATPLSSDGIFVFHRAVHDRCCAMAPGTYFPVVGDEVMLRGTVREDFFQTRA